LRAVSVAAVSWCSAAVALDRHGAAQSPAGSHGDAIVVLGCRVGDDGYASAALAARARRAAELYHRGVAPRIVTTGGVGAGDVAEADAAAEVLERLGVPDEAIVRERRSTSTHGNAIEAAALLGPARVVIVSDAYHLFRARRVFARAFTEVDAVPSEPDDGSVRVVGALREVAAVAVYAARGRL
jgi:uncharacterized SAM-binding protein YcdF (DUF218 family)